MSKTLCSRHSAKTCAQDTAGTALNAQHAARHVRTARRWRQKDIRDQERLQESSSRHVRTARRWRHTPHWLQRVRAAHSARHWLQARVKTNKECPTALTRLLLRQAQPLAADMSRYACCTPGAVTGPQRASHQVTGPQLALGVTALGAASPRRRSAAVISAEKYPRFRIESIQN